MKQSKLWPLCAANFEHVLCTWTVLLLTWLLPLFRKEKEKGNLSSRRRRRRKIKELQFHWSWNSCWCSCSAASPAICGCRCSWVSLTTSVGSELCSALLSSPWQTLLLRGLNVFSSFRWIWGNIGRKQGWVLWIFFLFFLKEWDNYMKLLFALYLGNVFSNQYFRLGLQVSIPLLLLKHFLPSFLP